MSPRNPFLRLLALSGAILLLAQGAGAIPRGWHECGLTFDRLVDRLEHLYQTDSLDQSSESTLTALETAYSAKPDSDRRIQLAYWRAELQYRGGTAADFTLSHDIARLSAEERPYEWVRLRYLELRWLLYRAKDYPRAYEVSMELVDKCVSHGFRRELALVYANQGLLMHLLGNYAEALDCQEKAARNFAGSGRCNDSLKNELNMANTLHKLGRTGHAVERLQALDSCAPVRANARLHSNILLSLYSYSHREEYARSALECARTSGDSVVLMKARQNMTELYMASGDYRSQLSNAREVWTFFHLRGEQRYELEPLNSMIEAYERTGRYDSACIFLRRYIEVLDSMALYEKMAEVHRIQSQSDITAQNARMLLAEERASNQRRKFWLIVSLCIVVVMLVSTVWYYEHRQNRTNRLKIDSQNRELTTNALRLLNKNQLLSELLHTIQNGGKDSDGTPADTSRAVSVKIRENLREDSRLNDFLLHFEKVHPDFFTTLKLRWPQLSEKDLKLCAYIRMGLSNKEIAHMQSILPESVNTTRYRLRKKMGLAGTDSLDDAIHQI